VSLNGARILDAGCGIGTWSGEFRRRFSPHVEAIEIEAEAAKKAQESTPHVLVAAGEMLPYKTGHFDFVFSNEVIEHVQDDRQTVAEMVRVTRPGGRIVIFCPNRWYPVEQHGHYWRGKYYFGNTPLINYLPDFIRNRLAPHVRTYTAHGLRRLFADQPVRIVAHTRIFGGYDNIVRRAPTLGRVIRAVLYVAERTPLRILALSHFLVVEKLDRPT
jgi:SAM-dependent methyltransferase